MNVDEWSLVGETVGSYRIGARIGEGGMGVVYAAEHALLKKKAAVKLLRSELSRDPEMVNRFFNEAKLVSQIRHPGMADVFDFGFHDSGAAFLVMELLEGETLAALMRRGRVPLAMLLAIARQVSSALAAAHARGVVHRDLKPDNVFLVADADAPLGQRAKVLDFGIAKLAQDTVGFEDRVKTRTGMVMGTPLYMSPEQCSGAASIDARADVYSLGCVLYEMASGRPPFEYIGVGDIMAAHLKETPRPLRDLATLPAALSALVMKMLAKAPAGRPAGMRDVGDALEEIERTGDGGPSRTRLDELELDDAEPELLELARPTEVGMPTVKGPVPPPDVARAKTVAAVPALMVATAIAPVASAGRAGVAGTGAASERRVPGRAGTPAPSGAPPEAQGLWANVREQLSLPWRAISPAGAIGFAVGFALFVLIIFAAEPGFIPILDGTNLVFHEAGHPVYGIFGEGPALYGGTLGQLTFPFICALVFFWQRRAISFAVCVIWLFENFLNIARYAADARAQQLPLIGGGEHDWLRIFMRWNALASDLTVGRWLKTIGWLGMLAGAAFVAYRFARDRKDGRTPDPWGDGG